MRDAKQHSPHFLSPVIDHWRGRNALLPTLLISVLLISTLMQFLPRPAGFFGSVLALVTVWTVLVWQIVGTWRAVNLHLRSLGDSATAWLAYGALLVALSLAIFQTVDRYIGDFAKAEYLKQRADEVMLEINQDHSSMMITGQIDFDTLAAMRNTQAKFPDVRTVVLASDGGLVYAARTIAGNIIERGLSTHVDDSCSSACAIIFAAGKRRTVGQEAKLGFHRYQFQKVQPLRKLDSSDEQAKDIEFFRSRGVSDAFLRRAFQASHSQIWFPTKEELHNSGLITGG